MDVWYYKNFRGFVCMLKVNVGSSVGGSKTDDTTSEDLGQIWLLEQNLFLGKGYVLVQRGLTRRWVFDIVDGRRKESRYWGPNYSITWVELAYVFWIKFSKVYPSWTWIGWLESTKVVKEAVCIRQFLYPDFIVSCFFMIIWVSSLLATSYPDRPIVIKIYYKFYLFSYHLILL